MECGRVHGINHFVELEYAFKPRFGLGVNISYGMMFTKFGNTTTDKFTYNNTSTSSSNTNYYYTQKLVKDYKKQYFSSPEFSAYLYFACGKKLIPKTSE